jgi:hypothetical protein
MASVDAVDEYICPLTASNRFKTQVFFVCAHTHFKTQVFFVCAGENGFFFRKCREICVSQNKANMISPGPVAHAATAAPAAEPVAAAAAPEPAPAAETQPVRDVSQQTAAVRP